MTSPYKVIVIVVPDFGERLREIEPGVPVWIIDTPTNKRVVQQLWRERSTQSHLTGITSFKATAGSSAEEVLIGEMHTIDLHHGEYSANPPYTVIEAIGVELTEKIETELGEFGFYEFHETVNGFSAIRLLPTADNA